MLVVHHLRRSQLDRIVWLCEELELDYELQLYDREPSGAAPPAYKALHFFGTAPVIQDGALVLGESGAIIQYLCRTHGKGRLTAGSTSPNFAQYLHWLHFGNSTFVPAAMMAMPSPTADADDEERERLRRGRFDRAFDMAERRLGEAPYFAGTEFTAADIMMVFPLTRTRLAVPKDISEYPNILSYLQRIGTRPAFQRACEKSDAGIAPQLT